jgi:UDP-N-acetylglucosamine diphosphorylase/glucosamine-1-phosphate N-acetyltransferase
MSTPAVSAVILAAGKGTRMGSDLAKVLHPLAGRPLVQHVLAASRAAGIDEQVVVIGHQAEAVAAVVASPDVRTAIQDRQLGTGHAVRCAQAAVRGAIVVVLCGDAPLVPAELLRELLQRHRASGDACTAIAARMADPTGYGRMITGPDGRLQRIVEHRDASDAERAINLINSGIYAFDTANLFRLLATIQPANQQGEYYLTDVPKLLIQEGRGVGLLITDDADACMGINTPAQLAEAEAAYQRRRA